ncbi:YhgE/Pip domain-containing protein [Staphylococcus aureus M1423]|uniref:Phage infection protein n=20 Tax=Staphylococcus aureus TaxID=1280 RepID=A0A3M8Y623_STAAU|nr:MULTISPECIES: YhgE/Pip domain-containing protein [Staphylococcus]EGL92338.1 YhgE/Pip N-terminal domain protein [Staphylococcus aureus subsp. aureus 21318]EGS85438.1 YhgE/Pip N-terminal domain protein [Staphylococcus aureus subsp. aureus 21266]EGS86055.1 YhgE/Pip N-terminal domain protein [Staphylococcus aureus subsp. aureus 21259]EHS12317.1 YhgE/Pip N-terminal domain protein [Staphylococcus aureus subsp. aureus IS-99]ENK63252.1 YhgE/Pip domain-containing protein [Staphylococcus aureus M0562
MNIFKNKLLWIAPIATMIILVIFSLAFYPAYNPKPKDLPIGILNEDKGTTIQDKNVNIGKKLEDKLLDSDSNKIKWVKVDSEKDLEKDLKDQKIFGVAIIDKDFSKDAMSKTQKVVMDSKKEEMQQKVASGEIPPQVVQQMKQKMGNQQVEVKQAKFKTIVSEGSSLQGSQIASAVLTGMGDNINAQITKQSLETLTSQNVKVNAADINGLTNPVKVDNEKLNKVKDHQAGGNAPFLMFMPIWIGSIVTSILLFFAFRTSNNIVVQHRIIASIGQMIFAVVAAFAGSFVYIYFMQGVQGFDFDHPNRIAIFVAFAILGFVGLILGVMVWLGMKSVPIFFILMFFSMQLVTLPKQMLPESYQKYVYDWNPFTHYATSVRELLYLNHHIELNSTMWMFIGFMIFGAVSSLVSAIVRKHSTKRTEVPS